MKPFYLGREASPENTFEHMEDVLIVTDFHFNPNIEYGAQPVNPFNNMDDEEVAKIYIGEIEDDLECENNE